MRIPERGMTSGVMALVFCFFLGQALFFGSAARIMPLIISVPGLVLCLAQFAIDIKRPHEGETFFAAGEVTAIAWIAGFIAGLSALGFVYGAPLLIAAYLYFHSGERFLAAAIAGGCCWAFMYGFLDRLLGVQPFGGLLFEFWR